jgi:hypothetical protein
MAGHRVVAICSYSKQQRQPRRQDMYIDEVVVAGVLIVGLCVVFCAGFGYFIWKDAKKTKAN